MTSRPPPALLARHLSSTIVRQAAAGRHSPGEPKGRGVAWTEERSVSEPPGRGAAWTEERGTSDEGRRCLTVPRRASAEQSTSDEGRRRLRAPGGERETGRERPRYRGRSHPIIAGRGAAEPMRHVNTSQRWPGGPRPQAKPPQARPAHAKWQGARR